MADFPKAPPALDDGEPDPLAIEFEPYQRMVKWFTPSELARTGAEAVISSLFGAYADNRELQALRGRMSRFDYSTEPPTAGTGDDRRALAASDDVPRPVDEIWIDYVADLGDGWDPTFSIASLLAAETLTVGGVETQRGRVLVLGGDQVYPTAKREEYQNRFAGPYRAALPYVADTPPHLFAIPGNHDWYDGLTSFTRLLCQGRWIGGWKTQQRRSYFALKLPGDWWLWGVDVQLSSDLDEPQLTYFRKLGAQIEKESGPANIILCLAEPVWAKAGVQKDMAAYDTLARFEDLTMTRFGHRHVVGLAGDLHAYARWEDPETGRQRFISGGGGAYLYPSHLFPPRLRLPTVPLGPERNERDEDGQEVNVERFPLATTPPGTGPPRKAIYPPERPSWELAGRVVRFPALNKRFSLFFGMFYLVLAWLVQSASKALGTGGDSFFKALAGPPTSSKVPVGPDGIKVPAGPEGPTASGDTPFSLWDAFTTGARELGDVLAHAPLAALMAALLLAGLTAFADGDSHLLKRTFGDAPGRLIGKVALGVAHTVMHLSAFVLLTIGFVWFNTAWLPDHGVLDGTAVDAWPQVLLFGVEMATVGSAVGGVVWALYLFLAHLVRRHSNEVFSSQSIPDYKHFLRLHVRPDGLTIYPIGIDKVPRTWAYQPGADGTPWFLPKRSERARADGAYAGDGNERHGGDAQLLADRAHLVDGPVEVPASVPEADPGPSRATDVPSDGRPSHPILRREGV